eukprot:gene8450-275_t
MKTVNTDELRRYITTYHENGFPTDFFQVLEAFEHGAYDNYGWNAQGITIKELKTTIQNQGDLWQLHDGFTLFAWVLVFWLEKKHDGFTDIYQ